MTNDPNKDARIFDHEADGIRELDNLLPRWWVWLFWLCNVFGLAYMLYFHVFHLGDLQAAAYTRDAQEGNQIKAAALAEFEVQLSSLEPSNDPATLRDGQRVFTT